MWVVYRENELVANRACSVLQLNVDLALELYGVVLISILLSQSHQNNFHIRVLVQESIEILA